MPTPDNTAYSFSNNKDGTRDWKNQAGGTVAAPNNPAPSNPPSPSPGAYPISLGPISMTSTLTPQSPGGGGQQTPTVQPRVDMDRQYTNIPASYFTEKPELRDFLNSLGQPKNSDPSKPSSSASSVINNNAAVATNNATTSQPSANQTAAGSLYNMLQGNGMGGMSANDIQTLMDQGMSASEAAGLAVQMAGQRQAQQAKSEQEMRQQQQYQSSLASQNAMYGQSVGQLNNDRKNSIDTATAQLAQLNTSGGVSSDSAGFISHINAQYDMAQQSLNLQAEQARAALDAGNSQAYAQINANMEKTLEGVRNNVTNLLSTIQGNKVAGAQFQQQEQDKATTAYQQSLINLPQPEDLAKLPGEVSKLSPEQKKQLEGNSAYQLAIKAGITPQAALSDIQSAATDAYKKRSADTAVQRAQIAALNAQTSASKAQATQAVIQAVASIPQATGFKFGSDAYLGEVFKATAASDKPVPQVDRQRLDSYMLASDQFAQLATATKSLDGKNPLVTLVQSKTPWMGTEGDQKVSLYRAYLQRVAPTLAKSLFSETGRLTNFDIQNAIESIGPMNTTSEVRDAILLGTYNLTQEAMYHQLISDANGGYNVSAYQPAYDSVRDKIHAAIESSGGKISYVAPDGQSWYFSSVVDLNKAKAQAGLQ